MRGSDSQVQILVNFQLSNISFFCSLDEIQLQTPSDDLIAKYDIREIIIHIHFAKTLGPELNIRNVD